MSLHDGELTDLGGSNFHGAEAALRRAAQAAHRRAEVAGTETGNSPAFGTMAAPHDSDRDPRKLSFSQAQGYQELPKPLKLGELPSEARIQIWNVLYNLLNQSKNESPSRRRPSSAEKSWANVLRRVHAIHDNEPLDDWNPRFESICISLRHRIENQDFNEVFDLIQYIMRDRECPENFVKYLQVTFKRCKLAYAIDSGPPPTIFPSVTAEEGQAIGASLQALAQAGLQGSASHLRNSAECVNKGDWAGSIRESIHAVESVARQIAPNEPDTLTQALNSVAGYGSLHPKLKDALKELYWYSSDEQGIRHALLDQDKAKVGMDEAVFMLGACASFASYLWRKHAAGGNP